MQGQIQSESSFCSVELVCLKGSEQKLFPPNFILKSPLLFMSIKNKSPFNRSNTENIRTQRKYYFLWARSWNESTSKSGRTRLSTENPSRDWLISLAESSRTTKHHHHLFLPANTERLNRSPFGGGRGRCQDSELNLEDNKSCSRWEVRRTVGGGGNTGTWGREGKEALAVGG